MLYMKDLGHNSDSSDSRFVVRSTLPTNRLATCFLDKPIPGLKVESL